MILSPNLAALRETVRAIEGERHLAGAVLPFGLDALDTRLGDGGMRRDALHEVAGVGESWADDGAAVLFMAGIAARARGDVLWVLRSRDLFAPGLYQAGLDPDRVLYAEAKDDAELLALMEEGLRHRGLGAVVGEAKTVSMTATRRLQLAAEGGRTIAMLLRRPTRRGTDPLGAPSTAVTRWRVGAAPSAPVAWGGLGPACWQLSCVRQRGGAPFELTVEAADETGRIALPAQLVDRPDQAGRAHADARTIATAAA